MRRPSPAKGWRSPSAAGKLWIRIGARHGPRQSDSHGGRGEEDQACRCERGVLDHGSPLRGVSLDKLDLVIDHVVERTEESLKMPDGVAVQLAAWRIVRGALDGLAR
jgi:hypothetical protein